MAKANRTEIFDAPIEKVFQVISDIESYPDFMDGVSAIDILESKAKTLKAQYSLNIIKKFKYVLDIKHNGKDKLEWTLDSGDLFSKNSGVWTLTSLEDDKTQVEYDIDVEFKVKVPGLMMKKLTSSNLPSMMKAVHKRAKKL